MNNLQYQIVECWQIHNRIMLFLIENIPEEAFGASLSKKGGRDISRQFGHLQNVRYTRWNPFAKKIGKPLTQFDTKEHPSKSEIYQAFEFSGQVMEKIIEDSISNDAKVSNFKRGIVPMIGYYISHECHHRGNILATMKMNGFKVSDELKWKLWEWNKI